MDFSSVAMEIGRPSNYHYSSKAALTILARAYFIDVTINLLNRILKTGLVDTSMSKNKLPLSIFKEGRYCK